MNLKKDISILIIFIWIWKKLFESENQYFNYDNCYLNSLKLYNNLNLKTISWICKLMFKFVKSKNNNIKNLEIINWVLKWIFHFWKIHWNWKSYFNLKIYIWILKFGNKNYNHEIGQKIITKKKLITSSINNLIYNDEIS